MYKYKAFISYRHCSYDMAVAKKLHRLLESFRIPDKLKRKGEKWVIFRDQEELPLCNDLSERIKIALRQSEYLIVICSRRLNAKDSVWCKEEIRYFKELHQGSTRNIIAVLIDGTPAECFPEEICQSCDNGTVRTVEPLAANIVADDVKNAFRLLKTEYLRLAACMLGCNYDDLYRREHRRKQIIGGSALAVLLLIASISVYSAVTIYGQNQALLYEQSEVLTTQAQVLWEKGKPIEAIRLLLSVLPESDDDRPVNVNAEYVLSEQIGAYELETFLPGRVLEHQSQVNGIHYVGKGNVILTGDDDNVYFWSREDYSLIRKYGADELGSHHFGVYVEECKYDEISIKGGAPVWGTPYSHMRLLGGTCEIEYGDQVDPAIFMFDESNVWRLDGETASIIWHTRFEQYLSYPSLKLTEEGLLVITDWYSDQSGKLLCVLNPETGELNRYGNGERITSQELIHGNRSIRRERIGETFYLVCRDTEASEMIWAKELPITEHLSMHSDCLAAIELIEQEKTDNYSDFIVYALENYLCVLNVENGALIAEYTFRDNIATIRSSENGVLLLTDTNRTEYAIKLNQISRPQGDALPVCYNTNVFLTDADLIARYAGEYLTCASGQTEVYVYQERHNPDYEEPYPEADYYLNPSGAYAVMHQRDDSETYKVIDLETLMPLHSLSHITPEEASCYGFIDEDKCIFVSGDNTIVYDVMRDEIYSIVTGAYYNASDDGKWLIGLPFKEYAISDLEGKKYSWEIPDNTHHYVLSGDAQYMCYDVVDQDTGKRRIGFYHMTEGTTFELNETDLFIRDYPEKITWLTDREVAVVYDDDVIEVYDAEKKKLIRSCNFGDLLPAKRHSLHTIGNSDAVVVICENGKICRLDLIHQKVTDEINLYSIGESGVSYTTAGILKDPDYPVYAQLVKEDNLLILIAHVGTGWNDAWFLDLDSFSLRCKVPLFCDYSAKTGKIVVTTLSNLYVYDGFLPYYGTDELIQRAKDFLGEN